MLKSLKLIVFLLLSNVAFGQSFINGDFELNSASWDQINLSNADFNSFMSNCNGFGQIGNLDIISSNSFSGGPYSGNWFVALTGATGDLLALELNMPLVSGNSYTITFYDKKDPMAGSFPVEIGLSTSNNSFGTVVYTAPTIPLDYIWTQRTFTFIAPNNGQFITVSQAGGSAYDSWMHVDNFSMDCSINLNLGNDTTLCQGQTITLNGGSATSYLWSNGSTASSINVSSPGNYWVQASNGQCSARDTIAITLDLLPEINLGNDTIFCTQTQHIISPTNTGGTISNFVWQDNSTGNSLITSNSGNYWLQASNSCGVSIDSINLTLFQLIIPTDTVSICPGSSYTLANGTNIILPGTYSDTLNVLGYLGCDSIIQRVIKWYPLYNDTIQVALCSGTSFTTSSGIALTLPGFYSDTLNIQNQFGCDSIQVIEILNLPTLNSIQNRTICFGQSFMLPDGSSQNTAGIYIVTLTSVSGCDSIITINLTLSPPITTLQNIQICSGQSYILPSGISVNTAGTYLDTLAAASGCDSIITINLTLSPPITTLQNIQICSGQSYILPSGISVNIAGTYFDTLTTFSGCDSIITINLTLSPTITSSQNIEICSGQNYILPSGISVNTAGTYFDTLISASGCDSVVIINLNFYNDVFIPMIPEMGLCDNDSILFSIAGNFNQITWSNGQNGNSVIIYQPGNYQVNVLDVNGCSNSASFNVTELSLPSISLELSDSSICKGDCIKLSILGANSSEISWFINNDNFHVNDEYILYCFNDTGAYNFSVSSIEECGIAYDTLSIIINEPLVFLPSDTLIQFGDSLNLWSQGDYSEFWWQPFDLLLCDSCESQNIAITDNQRFTLFYTNTNGCIFNKSFVATINKDGQLYIPNSFTPNGDNINDEFIAKGTGISKFNLMIYNRIGELIFESSDIEKGWDGTYFQRQVQQDYYTYIIEYMDYNNIAKVERGFVMLAR
jgi:gliding motility-associated-like protein